MGNNQGFSYPIFLWADFWNYGKNYYVPQRDARNFL